MKKRKTWEEYFMNIVDAAAERSTCDRGKPGCIFVKDNQVLVTGYAGSPPGFPHCDEVGHLMEVRYSFIPIENIDTFFKDEDPKTLGYSYNSSPESFEGPIHQHCIRTIHAEQNAIIQAAKRGISLEGSTCYVTMTPCRTCTMFIISLGVKNVVCKNFYQKAQESIIMFSEANIPIKHLLNTTSEYS